MGGFAFGPGEGAVAVEIPQELLSLIPESKRKALTEVLSQDPRPSYQSDPTREYGMEYGDWEIRFTVDDPVSALTVTEILRRTKT